MARLEEFLEKTKLKRKAAEAVRKSTSRASTATSTNTRNASPKINKTFIILASAGSIFGLVCLGMNAHYVHGTFYQLAAMSSNSIVLTGNLTALTSQKGATEGINVSNKYKYRSDRDPQKESLAYDKNLKWDPTVERPWLYDNLAQDDEPPLQILLTSYGWNHPNVTLGLQTPRSLRETDLMEGLINHPWFHPMGWNDLQSRQVPVRHDIYYYVFLDKFTCYDHHWPEYGHVGPPGNMDAAHHRTTDTEADACWRGLIQCEDFLRDVFSKSVLFQETTTQNNHKSNARLIYLDCIGPRPEVHSHQTYVWPISQAIMETVYSKINPEKDMGLPPPAIHPVPLTAEQEHTIATCHHHNNNTIEEDREWFFLYWGNYRSGPNPAGTSPTHAQ